jgi:acyl-CoA dehydrogenase
MDFSIDPGLLDLQARVRRFIADEVIPLERDPRQGAHGPEPALRSELIGRARAAGLLSPHVSPEFGGHGV